MLFFIVGKRIAPEDILLEILANPAPMLLRLLPPETALSLSSVTPSGPFNFAIYVKCFNHWGSLTFLATPCSMSQCPSETEAEVCRLSFTG